MEPDSVSLDTKLDEEIKETVEEVKEAIEELKDEGATEDKIAAKVADLLKPYIDLALKKQEMQVEQKLDELTEEPPEETTEEVAPEETSPPPEEGGEEESYDVKPRRSHKLFYRPMRKDEQ